MRWVRVRWGVDHVFVDWDGVEDGGGGWVQTVEILPVWREEATMPGRGCVRGGERVHAFFRGDR